MLQILIDPSPSAALSVSSQGPSSLVVASIVSAIVVILLLGIVLRTWIRKLMRPELDGLNREQIAATWKEIQKTSDQGLIGAKVAIIEADKLLDHVLKAMLMPGETLGERLKMAAYKYPNIRKIWPAHKLRNQLVHESSSELTVRQAKGALSDYEAALKMLNVL